MGESDLLRFVVYPSLRRLTRAALVLAVLAAPAGTLAPPARAGDYLAYVCKTPSGAAIPLDRFWAATVAQRPAVAEQNCATGGPITVAFGGPGGQSRYNLGLVSGWTLTPPSPIKIVVVSGRRAVTTNLPQGDGNANPGGPGLGATSDYRIVGYQPGNSSLIEACQFTCNLGNGAFVDDPGNAFSFTPAPSDSMVLTASCFGDTGGTCINPGYVRLTASISRMTLQLRDDVVPTVDTIGGPALAAGAIGGTALVNFVAQDQGAGIYQYAVALDAVEIARGTPSNVSGTCADAVPGNAADLEFTSIQPCPTRVDVGAPVDTTKVGNGAHRLTVSVRDAAGNVTLVVDRQITVQNAVSGGAGGATPAPTTPNGTTGDLSTAALVEDTKHRVVRTSYGRRLTVKRFLRDGSKRPVAGAVVDVAERIDAAGAAWMHVASVRTDDLGAFRYVPKTTASRTLRFTYARAVGGAASSSIDVRVGVTARMRIAAAAHAVRPRHTIELSGAVALDGIPRRSRVEVQYRSRSGWRTIATERIDSKGHWSFDYRLTTAHRTTIVFRALLRPTADIAAEPSHSGSTSVRVS